jgi:hypothetical protein
MVAPSNLRRSSEDGIGVPGGVRTRGYNNARVSRWHAMRRSTFGLPSYPGLYDKFLSVVGLGINAATAWYAWNSLA